MRLPALIQAANRPVPEKAKLDQERVRRLLAIAAAVLGAGFGYWKAGIAGALVVGPAAGGLTIAAVTLLPVGISFLVVLLGFAFLFLIYALIYQALNL